VRSAANCCSSGLPFTLNPCQTTPPGLIADAATAASGIISVDSRLNSHQIQILMRAYQRFSGDGLTYAPFCNVTNEFNDEDR